MRKESVMCGGTSRSVDENAPKTIQSDKMIFFKAGSSFITQYCPDPDVNNQWINYVLAYAAKIEGGTLLVLSANDHYERNEFSWAFIQKDIFPELVKMVRDADLARNNGECSFTHGLPENFGGEVLIKYESGEKIHYSDNQSSVFGKDFGIALYELFTREIKTERAEIPDAEKITAVKFNEINSSGYTRGELFKNADGTCTLKKIYKFEDPRISEYTETVSGEALNNIKEIVKNCAVLLWDKLPESGFNMIYEQSLTFVFEDESEIVVDNSRAFPPGLSDAFFKIEREIMSCNYS